jgi:hypothetical protein
MHLVAPGAATEEVGSAPLELAGAGAAQDEAQPAVLDQPVDLVEQGRDFLHLVEDHRLRELSRVGREQPLAQQRRAACQLQHQVGLQQVEGQALRERGPQVGALPGLPRAPQECPIAGWGERCEASDRLAPFGMILHSSETRMESAPIRLRSQGL